MFYHCYGTEDPYVGDESREVRQHTSQSPARPRVSWESATPVTTAITPVEVVVVVLVVVIVVGVMSVRELMAVVVIVVLNFTITCHV